MAGVCTGKGSLAVLPISWDHMINFVVPLHQIIQCCGSRTRKILGMCRMQSWADKLAVITGEILSQVILVSGECMSCLNGGTFIGRGMCSCPPQWTGNMCQDGKVDSWLHEKAPACLT